MLKHAYDIDDRAVAFVMLVECYAVVRQPQQPRQAAFSVLDRFSLYALAVDLSRSNAHSVTARRV
jgi:hypothetical protein